VDAQRVIARRFVVGLPRDGLAPGWERDFADFTPAGVILFARDFRDLDDLRQLTRRLRELARPRRIWITIDEEGGFVSQLGGHLTVPPGALLLGRGAAPGDLEWVARLTGERLRALGVDWVFAPVADVHSEPANPVIGPRAFGNDPAVVAARVGELLRGFRAAGAASCLKHFPGHGDTVLDSHLDLPRCDAALATLERRELVPFRDNLDAPAVMTAHVVYAAWDPSQPATFSGAIADRLLRERLGYRGVSITDALEMRGAAADRTPVEVARRALEAGCDLLLFAFHDPELRRARLELARALVDGGLDRARFDRSPPRLMAMDRAHPEPGAELERPLEALTPRDWESRLEAIVERGLLVSGALPASAAAGSWAVSEPDSPSGPALAAELARAAVPLGGAEPVLEVVAVATRTPLDSGRLEELRALCRRRPTVLVGLQNDAFLEQLPEAALRISAADATPLTRRVVARTLLRHLRASAEARA
jgi:beta-glucosidase-like glycosyl hydrolase